MPGPAQRGTPLVPLLLVVDPTRLAELELRDDLFDDFCVAPWTRQELEARLAPSVLADRAAGGPRRSSSTGRWCSTSRPTRPPSPAGPLDLTYMEYELLKFLATHPGKVFTRETLLNRVWGYEYYGGARTVDVHVRRLRAKLGEEHAHLIQTVRVGRLPLRPGGLEPVEPPWTRTGRRGRWRGRRGERTRGRRVGL